MITETIAWKSVDDEMPDDAIDVLVFGKMANSDDNAFVWPGWFDSSDDCWRNSHSAELESVTHWADMPAGPNRC
jgi:hypothetical protein